MYLGPHPRISLITFKHTAILHTCKRISIAHFALWCKARFLSQSAIELLLIQSLLDVRETRACTKYIDRSYNTHSGCLLVHVYLCDDEVAPTPGEQLWDSRVSFYVSTHAFTEMNQPAASRRMAVVS